jgi:precorrin-6B methylase 2
MNLALAALALALALCPAWGHQTGGLNKTRLKTLKVIMPSYSAELKIDGKKLDKPGFERIFKIPEDIILPAGKDSIELVATIRPNNYTLITRTRKVSLAGGVDIVVDLRKEDARQPDRIFIRYLSTPPDIVEAMLKLGRVGPKDTVYDLGCGDGRMVIDAVGLYGAKRGVGIDLDPERIKQSKENARAAGVADKVEFRQGDVLDIKDLSDADVVLLFLSQDMNLALRPLLQKTLKPGARVVSSYFSMGSWKPDRTELVLGEDGNEYPLHLWIIK